MENKKITKALLLISVIATVFDVARLDIWGTTNLLYLVWNLFLAWIPYIISSSFIKKNISLNLFIPLFFVWLLFFPNAPYLVTDVLHIASPSPALWYDSLLFFLFGWIGLFLGILSLFYVHRHLKAHLNYFFSEISILIICFISSFGIYLGRFERWNSWDIFLSPLVLIRHLFNLSVDFTHGGIPLMFVIVFTIFMYFTYKTVYVLLAQELHSSDI